ncbi:MAG: amidohydrolase family protein [Phycisphaerae bacterium]|nr:amidohydrolase family protein [Phycisphaerae bacterium]
MATLGNMEIMRKDDELGSIEKGKYADLVLLAKNPLEDIKAIQNVLMVFKDGRLVHKRILAWPFIQIRK